MKKIVLAIIVVVVCFSTVVLVATSCNYSPKLNPADGKTIENNIVGEEKTGYIEVPSKWLDYSDAVTKPNIRYPYHGVFAADSDSQYRSENMAAVVFANSIKMEFFENADIEQIVSSNENKYHFSDDSKPNKFDSKLDGYPCQVLSVSIPEENENIKIVHIDSDDGVIVITIMATTDDYEEIMGCIGTWTIKTSL